MATNIEMNILKSDGKYEVLYPKTLASLLEGTLPIANGGTGGSTASEAMYNLTSPLGVRTAANLNSYPTSTYIPCYYSTTAYKFPLANIMTYVNRVVSVSGTLAVNKGGTGLTSLTSGYALIGNGTNPVALRAITNNTSATAAISENDNLITMNTLRYALNRTTGPGTADTSYTTSMMRPIAAGTSAPSTLTSGCIYLVYES